MIRILLYLFYSFKSLQIYRLSRNYNLSLNVNSYIVKGKSKFETKLALFLYIFIFRIKTSNKDPPILSFIQKRKELIKLITIITDIIFGPKKMMENSNITWWWKVKKFKYPRRCAWYVRTVTERCSEIQKRIIVYTILQTFRWQKNIKSSWLPHTASPLCVTMSGSGTTPDAADTTTFPTEIRYWLTGGKGWKK